MAIALFIIFPIVSHYNACFGLAQKLKVKYGYRIIFTGTKVLKEHVESQGFEFIDLDYTIDLKINNIKEFLFFFINTLLNKKSLQIRYKMWYKSVLDIRNKRKMLNPKIIMIDAHLSHYYLYLFDFRKLIYILSTKLCTKKSTGIPPLNSSFTPKFNLISKIICEYLWLKNIYKQKLINYIYKFAFLCKDEFFFEKRLCKKYKIKWNEIFDEKNSCFIGLKNVKTIILGNSSLEFPQKKKFKNQYYLDIFFERNEEKYFSSKYLLLKDIIKKKEMSKIIFCSFGTTFHKNSNEILDFINRLVDIILEDKRLFLILTLNNLKVNYFKINNIYIIEKVPQLDIMNYVDLVITHGGHNTIKECIHKKLPILVYPVNKNLDQPSNGAKVQFNNYGLLGSLKNDTSEEIQNKINRLLK